MTNPERTEMIKQIYSSITLKYGQGFQFYVGV